VSRPTLRRHRRATISAARRAGPSAYQVEALENRVLLSTFFTLASFNATTGETPRGSVAVDSFGNLFGATEYGGTSSDGTVFEIAQGSGIVTRLASFIGANGQSPWGGVVLDSAGNLFGTTNGGGVGSSDGTVFEVAHGSSAITALASFNNATGENPQAGVVLDSSGDIFGTTSGGGANGYGTVFEIAHASGTITTLASFNGTNGQYPNNAGVVLDSSGNLFGTTTGGGDSSGGTVFEIANGSYAITKLASFNGGNGSESNGVVLDSSGDLFGTAQNGGTYGDGAVFEVVKDSGAITTMASFNIANGQYPRAAVILDSSGDLIGTTYGGGTNGDGAVFEIAQGSGSITTLVSFNATNGKNPYAGVVLDSAGDLFGTTATGASPNGTAFELTAVTPGSTAVTSSNASPIYGQPVIFTATVTPSVGVGPTGTVQFQVDGNNLGSPVALSGNTASYTTSMLSAGSHSVMAVYSGDGNYAGSTSAVFTQNVGQAPLTLTANTVYIKLAPDGQHVDVWNNSTASGSPDQCVPCSDICGVTYTGPAGGDTVVLDFSNGDPLPAGGISLTGGAGQNTLELVGDPASDSDSVAINGGSFALPANAQGAGTLNYALGTVSIAAGAALALAESDSQTDQTVFTANALSVAGMLDITNNTLLANETSVPLSQVMTWVQNAASQPCIMSSLVTGPDSQASRAVGYGDGNEDPLTVPTGDVEVKYVPVGDTNLDGMVDITDLTRAINNLGQSAGYGGGDVANQGIVNIVDIADIINDLGGNLSAGGDGADAPRTSAAAVQPSPAATSTHSAVTPLLAGNSCGTLFSQTQIQESWLDWQAAALAD